MRPADSFVGQPVRSLQTMLRILAEDDRSISTVIPDGIYGSQTRNAVSAFQRKYGLPVTGVTDQATWEKIVTAQTAARTRLLAAQPLQLILNPNQVLRRGDNHPYVYVVQSMLVGLGQIYGSIIPPNITGVIDAPTVDALASFQHLCALPQTGELDKITWKHLALQYPLAVNIPESKNRRYFQISDR